MPHALSPAYSSEPQIAFAAAVAAAALAAALLLLVAIAAMRALGQRRAERITRQEEAWRRAIHQAMEEPPAPGGLAAVSDSDLPEFLMLWNRLREALAAAAADNMGELLRANGLDVRAIRLLHAGSLRSQLIAMTTLGHLRDERAWGALESLAQSGRTVVSFAAARALMRIEPRRALDALAASIVQRTDWSVARLGCVFAELGPATVTPSLTTMLISRPRAGLDRVVKLARFGDRARIAPIMRGWLSASDDPDIIMAALDYVEDERELPWAKGAAQHSEWRVRMAAAKALGRIAAASELATLLELLRDPVWWVRFHAAQALTRLHGMTTEELQLIRERARDSFAADMLAHALAAMPARKIKL
jgi:HEAT repeat protein